MSIFDSGYVRRMREFLEDPNRNQVALDRMKSSMSDVEREIFPEPQVLPSDVIKSEITSLRVTATKLTDLVSDIKRIMHVLEVLLDGS